MLCRKRGYPRSFSSGASTSVVVIKSTINLALATTVDRGAGRFFFTKSHGQGRNSPSSHNNVTRVPSSYQISL